MLQQPAVVAANTCFDEQYYIIIIIIAILHRAAEEGEGGLARPSTIEKMGPPQRLDI